MSERHVENLDPSPSLNSTSVGAPLLRAFQQDLYTSAKYFTPPYTKRIPKLIYFGFLPFTNFF
jgi:hypothetical protein